MKQTPHTLHKKQWQVLRGQYSCHINVKFVISLQHRSTIYISVSIPNTTAPSAIYTTTADTSANTTTDDAPTDTDTQLIVVIRYTPGRTVFSPY